MRIAPKWNQSILVCVIGIFLLSGYAAAATEVASPPPENAALLYYQILARVGIPSFTYPPEDLPDILNRFDEEPGPMTIQIVKEEHFQRIIGLILLATQAESCDWGFTVSEGWTRLYTGISLESQLCHLVVADAWVLAAKGKYVPAMEAALALRRLARHMGDDDFTMWNAAVNVDYTVLRTIGGILERMPPNEETLAWLEKELAVNSGPVWQPRTSLTQWGDLASRHISPCDFALWKDHNVAEVKDNALRKELEGLSETEALRRAHRAYTRYIDSAVGILESEASYPTTQSRLETLEGDAFDDPNTNPIIYALGDGWMGTNIIRHYYNRHIKLVARIHATRTAIQVYRVSARTGQLPQSLPNRVWFDPYSGKDFEYEITDDGFMLRCGPASCPDTYAPPKEFYFKVAQDSQKAPD